MNSGYMHGAYAEALSEFGSPMFLPACGGWVLRRRVPNSRFFDAMGCYPLFVCSNESQLHADLETLGNGLLAISLVTDPFASYDLKYLQQCFKDVVVPFKQHFVVDLRRPLESFVHPHHRRNVARASKSVLVENCVNPTDFLEDWIGLYQTLIVRHHITGLTAFSRDSFDKQFRVPGVVVFRAVYNDSTVGMLIWYEHSNRAYYHLGAYSSRGYDLRASFALFDYAIRYFAERRFDWLNLGSGAGAGNQEDSGLIRFKRGWSTGTRTAYFCGRIFDETNYRTLSDALSGASTTYFPAYRVGEFS